MSPLVLIYDLEIVNGIPPKSEADREPGIEYCGGWRDFENMGISAASYTWLSEHVPIDEPPVAFEWRDELARDLFVGHLQLADIIAGFNSESFDDKLLAANGVEVRTTFDILYECRKAAYGSHRFQDQPQGSCYKLDAIAQANGYAKTGRGDLAPIWWQKGDRPRVVEYCRNDVEIERRTLKLLLDGELTDPNTGLKFAAPTLEPKVYGGKA